MFKNYSFTIDFCWIKCHYLGFQVITTSVTFSTVNMGGQKKFDFTLHIFFLHRCLSLLLTEKYIIYIFSFFRSLPDFGVFSISALNKLAMFQTYAGEKNIYSNINMIAWWKSDISEKLGMCLLVFFRGDRSFSLWGQCIWWHITEHSGTILWWDWQASYGLSRRYIYKINNYNF